MTDIDKAKQRFLALLTEIERDMGCQIQDVHLWRESVQSVFNGKPYERNETRVTILFG